MDVAEMQSRLASRRVAYLDTNAWSVLAKGDIDPSCLADWLKDNDYVLWMARFQLAELSGSERIVDRYPQLFRRLDAYMFDILDWETAGMIWHEVPHVPLLRLTFSDTDGEERFKQHFLRSASLAEARSNLRRDAASYARNLSAALEALSAGPWPTWASFDARMEAWLKEWLERKGVHFIRPMLLDNQRYIGLKLSYAVLFIRYLINRSVWEESDYVDFLQAADMAYAGVVVTEANLGECLKQAKQKLKLMGPDRIERIQWLKTCDVLI